jgi:hypothetical protein
MDELIKFIILSPSSIPNRELRLIFLAIALIFLSEQGNKLINGQAGIFDDLMQRTGFEVFTVVRDTNAGRGIRPLHNNVITTLSFDDKTCFLQSANTFRAINDRLFSHTSAT